MRTACLESRDMGGQLTRFSCFRYATEVDRIGRRGQKPESDLV